LNLLKCNRVVGCLFYTKINIARVRMMRSEQHETLMDVAVYVDRKTRRQSVWMNRDVCERHAREPFPAPTNLLKSCFDIRSNWQVVMVPKHESLVALQALNQTDAAL
jgi:hypothetical protein